MAGMMTDHKELLELAARACGITVIRSRLHDPGFQDFLIQGSARNTTESLGGWNPITDDGDCARMEAQLGIDIEWRVTEGCVVAKARIDGDLRWRFEYFADHNNDRNSARRLASTRVAAEIGRRMST